MSYVIDQKVLTVYLHQSTRYWRLFCSFFFTKGNFVIWLLCCVHLLQRMGFQSRPKVTSVVLIAVSRLWNINFSIDVLTITVICRTAAIGLFVLLSCGEWQTCFVVCAMPVALNLPSPSPSRGPRPSIKNEATFYLSPLISPDFTLNEHIPICPHFFVDSFIKIQLSGGPCV